MTAVVGLDHVQVAAPKGCEVEARRFYGELLGLAELDKPEPLREPRRCVVRSRRPTAPHRRPGPVFPARKAHPALRVRSEELDALAIRLAEAGAEVIWDDELPDVRRFFSEDPWGNRIELVADS